jgi:putative hydrolase of the HAD superfamily
MNLFIARVLGDGGTPLSQAAIDAARIGYWKRYGATLLGMMRHHQVSAAEFLRDTHQVDDLRKLMRFDPGLGRLLKRLPGRKIVLTNAPTVYSTEVMRHLGLRHHFGHHIAIENMQVHGQLRPKPSALMLRRLLRRHGAAASRCVLVEDTLANLRSAKRVGMRTVWITRYLDTRASGGVKRPAYVDVKVKSLRQLPARLHRLRITSPTS